MIHPNYSKFPLLLLCWLICLGLTKKATASHTYGVEISYKCLGNNQYKIQLTSIRDCDGIGFPNREYVNINSLSCGINIGTVELVLDTVYEMSQACPSVVSACNGGTISSIENHVYTGIVTFPQVCTDWVVSWTNCCRSPSITNLASSSVSLYVEAGINNTTCNSAPLYTSRPFMHFCAGNCYEYNYGGYDPDGDTLRYALSCPLQAANSCIPNITGLQPDQPLFTNPLNSFSFDEYTGQMSFCPSLGQYQHIVLDLTTYQISNGDTIGYTQKDIQLVVFDNVNCAAPPISTSPIVTAGGTFDNVNQLFEVCSGDILNFETTVYHPEGLPIYLDSINTNLDLIVGVGNWSLAFDTLAPYRADSVQVSIQITTTNEEVGMNYFTLSFRDNSCPFQWLETKGYQLSVVGAKASITAEGASSGTYCPGIATSIPLEANVNSSNIGSYSWTQIAGPTVTFSNNMIANPVVGIPSTTQDGDTIVVRLTYVEGGCMSTSDVIIHTKIQAIDLRLFASNTTLCPNNEEDTIRFTVFAGNPNIDDMNGTYTWSANPTSSTSNLINSTSNTPSAILNTVAGDVLSYQVNYDYGLCTDSASITLRTLPGELNISTSLDSICFGDTVQLMAILTDTMLFVDSTACTRYTVDSIPFAPITGSGNLVVLGDDELSLALPIGFDFDFYCTTYSQFKISSNGFITFDTSNANSGCCSGQLLPDTDSNNNLIAFCWEDFAPNTGGTITYFTTGLAPNRQLVVNFINVPRLGWGGLNTATVQVILHEGTNLIDIHNTSITGTSSDITTQGIENSTGTTGVAVLGRNGVAAWSANNDAFRFTPDAKYTSGPITYNWTPSNVVSDAAIHNPLGTPIQTTTYVTTVNEEGCVRTDSIDVVVSSALNVPVMYCDSFITSSNSILFDWGQVAGATGWEYSLDSGVTWTANLLQDSTFLHTGLQHGTCYGILVRALGGSGNCLVNAASYVACCTNLLSNVLTQNGTTLSAVATGSTITYQWIDCNNGNALIVGETGQSFTPMSNGSYAVIISDGVNTVISDCININITNITSTEEGTTIYCYPNPTTGQINIEKKNTERLDVRVLDPLGQVILEESMNSLKTSLDLSTYPTGVYIFQFRTAHERFSQKIIKQ